MRVKNTTTTAPEDPAIKAARDREQARADAAYVSNAQGVLDEQNRKRARRNGLRPLTAIAQAALGNTPYASGGGSVPLTTASPANGGYVPDLSGYQPGSV